LVSTQQSHSHEVVDSGLDKQNHDEASTAAAGGAESMPIVATYRSVTLHAEVPVHDAGGV